MPSQDTSYKSFHVRALQPQCQQGMTGGTAIAECMTTTLQQQRMLVRGASSSSSSNVQQPSLPSLQARLSNSGSRGDTILGTWRSHTFTAPLLVPTSGKMCCTRPAAQLCSFRCVLVAACHMGMLLHFVLCLSGVFCAGRMPVLASKTWLCSHNVIVWLISWAGPSRFAAAGSS